MNYVRRDLAQPPMLLLAAVLVLLTAPLLTTSAQVERPVQFSVEPAACPGGVRTIKATFVNTTAAPVDVGIAVYRLPNANAILILSTQVFHSSATGTVPGGVGQTLVLSAALPCCNYQADAFLGNPITNLQDVPDGGYGANLLNAVLDSSGQFCAGDNADGGCIPCERGDDGCTPGYWKNHTDSWAGSGFSPNQTTGSVFSGASAFPSLASQTLLQSLQGGGGPGTLGAAKILLRAATAALLNAAHPGVDYPRTTAEIIADVNAALASNNRATMLALATALDNDNNLGCPLN